MTALLGPNTVPAELDPPAGHRPAAGASTAKPRIGALFMYDWDAIGLDRMAHRYAFDRAGFDLFSFPSNVGLLGFDIERFAHRQAQRARDRGWIGVMSQQEHFGALAAALVAEELGLPGTAPTAILAAQHKLHARRVLQQVCPEACLPFDLIDCEYGGTIPEGIAYPRYVKPVKAAFSVLARQVHSRAELQQHTRFGWRELWVIRRLVEPFDRVRRSRLPHAGSAHRLMMEEPISAPQFNLDGWVFNGQAQALGVVDAIMYPGTQAFMRWDLPSQLPTPVQARALDVARRFLAAIGFTHGLFNMEFFYDAATDRLSVIEFNPRLAAQFSDLYLSTTGIDPHAISIALALGQDPALLPRAQPVAGAASSLVYRALSPGAVPPMPSAAQKAAFKAAYPDSLLFVLPLAGHALEREFKWLSSYRYGTVHLHGRDASQLRERAEHASALLGWPVPYADVG
ncbi:MAG: acetyl-CoA carboxylase biotin carboxylase subunit family protein [Leptothrix sp. (in: b-proteobacteria)]